MRSLRDLRALPPSPHIPTLRVSAPLPDEDLPAPPPATTHPSDLGVGRVVANQVRGRFLSHDGVPTSRKYGIGAQRAARFYLGALNVGWPAFVAWVVGIVLLLNGCCALAYAASGSGALHGATALGLDDPFLRAFSFSVGVFTTTGTGAMYAVGTTTSAAKKTATMTGVRCCTSRDSIDAGHLVRARSRSSYSGRRWSGTGWRPPARTRVHA